MVQLDHAVVARLAGDDEITLERVAHPQALGIEEITKGLAQMDDATQRNSALVEENAATAQNLESQARMMNDQVSFFDVNGSGDLAGTPGAETVMRPARAAAAARKARAA